MRFSKQTLKGIYKKKIVLLREMYAPFYFHIRIVVKNYRRAIKHAYSQGLMVLKDHKVG